MGAKDKKDVKILVVDDQRRVADTVVEIVSRAGYSVTPAYGGMEAVKRISGRRLPTGDNRPQNA